MSDYDYAEVSSIWTIWLGTWDSKVRRQKGLWWHYRVTSHDRL